MKGQGSGQRAKRAWRNHSRIMEAAETPAKAEDVGKFKAPTLRNIAVTAPCMHDGSVTTLEEELDHYAAGGDTMAEGPHRGIGRDNPNKAAAIAGFPLTAAQRAGVIAFLRSPMNHS